MVPMIMLYELIIANHHLKFFFQGIQKVIQHTILDDVSLTTNHCHKIIKKLQV